MSKTRTAPISELDEAELEPGRSSPAESGLEPPVARMGNSVFARVVESHPPSRGDLGTPLQPELRSWANAAFGADLSAVRLHTGSDAEQANREAGTSAYTVGSHIVLGSDSFPLLVHELAHSVQQTRVRGLSPGRPTVAHEGLADRAVEGALAGGRHVDVGPGAPVGFAGGDESKVGDLSRRLMRQLQSRMINQLMSSLGIRSTATDLVQCAVAGFVEELIAQLWTGNKGIDFLRAMLSVGVGDVAQLVKGYYVGLVKGLVSPVTDLFSLAVLAEKIQLLGPRILASVLADPSGLAADAQAVLAKVGAVAARVGDAWQNAKNDPAAAILGILEAQGRLEEFAKQQARNLGKAGATAVIDRLTGPLTPKPAEKPADESGFMGPLEWIESKLKSGDSAILDTPWSQIGSEVGYVVGFVAVQIAQLLFTSGVGNAVTQIAAGIAKVASALERVAKGAGAIVGKMADLAKLVGTAIAAVEDLLGVAMSKVLKPLEKILGPVVKPFEEAIAALKKFLENLFGVAKKQAAPAVEAAAGKAAATLTDDALRATPKPPTPDVLPAKAPEVAEPPTPSTTAPKTPEPAEPAKAFEPAAPAKTPETPEPAKTPETAKAAEPAETIPKIDAPEPVASTTPEPTPAEPTATPPTTDLEAPPTPTPEPAAAPATTQPNPTKPKTAKSKTAKPKTSKPKKPPKPTGHPDLDASLDRLENDYPAKIRDEIDPLIKSIRTTARKNPARAQLKADRIESGLDELVDDPHIDKEAAEWLTGRSATADSGEGRVFEDRPIRGKKRIPESEGAWDSDVPGQGDWLSFDPEVVKVTGPKPITYVDGEPVLAPYAKEKTILSGMTGDNDIDFPMAREGLMRQFKGRWKNVTHLERWEKGRVADNFGNKLTQQYTWHHEPDVETMSLVPTAMHSRIPHLGGAYKARAGMKPPRLSEDD